MKAARSASESQLRGKATSYLSPKNKKGKLLKTVTAARIAGALDKAGRDKAKKSSKPIKVASEVISRTDSPTTQFTPRQKAVTGGKKRPAALPAPQKVKKQAPKKNRGPKKEVTPGVQTVFKATPVVDLREGPNFGKVTSEIEKTFQPKTPKKKKDA